jgi:hypothetical protein
VAATIYFSMGNADAVRLDRFHAMDLWIPSSLPCFDDWVELIHLFRHIALTFRAWLDALGSFSYAVPLVFLAAPSDVEYDKSTPWCSPRTVARDEVHGHSLAENMEGAFGEAVTPNA